MFRRGLNCSDPNLITNNLEATPLTKQRTEDEGSNGNIKTRPKSCQKRCRKNCSKRCKKNRGKTCLGNCGKNCRKICRENRTPRGRNRKTGSHQNRSASNGNRKPLKDVLPLDGISEITNFVPSNIEHPVSNQEGNQNIQETVRDEQ